jgi:hypothetical protein
MARRFNFDFVSADLSMNGENDISGIYREMIKMFDQVAPAYKSKTNRTELDIRHAMKEAHQLIYHQARIQAPKIRPEIQAGKEEGRKDVHLSDKRYMIERQALGKKWRSQGIVARRVVTFKDPVSKYVAAVEYGRESFMQPIVRETKNGATIAFRKVGAAKAQPFLRKAQKRKAQPAVNEFSRVLKVRWLKTLKRVGQVNAAKAKGK